MTLAMRTLLGGAPVRPAIGGDADPLIDLEDETTQGCRNAVLVAFRRSLAMSCSPSSGATPLGGDEDTPVRPWINGGGEPLIDVAVDIEKETRNAGLVAKDMDLLRGRLSILGRMKVAAGRQRGMSMEVKKGLVQLEETISRVVCRGTGTTCVDGAMKAPQRRDAEIVAPAASGRKNGTSAAGKPTQVPPIKAVNAVVTSAVAPTPKRAASSPLERDTEKKRKESEIPSDWIQVRSKRAEKRRRRKEREKGNGKRREETEEKRTILPTQPQEAKKKKEQAKKRRNNNENGKRRARGSRRTDAILIKPAQGKTYAEVLAEVRNKANPADSGTEIRAVRKT